MILDEKLARASDVGAETERARIVAYVRQQVLVAPGGMEARVHLRRIADAIERGEHQPKAPA